jgi:hypothetical protein
MITFEMTEDQAELLLDILAETQFPLMSPQTEFAAQLFCELHEVVYEDEELEEVCECCGCPLEGEGISNNIVVNIDGSGFSDFEEMLRFDTDKFLRDIRRAQY